MGGGGRLPLSEITGVRVSFRPPKLVKRRQKALKCTDLHASCRTPTLVHTSLRLSPLPQKNQFGLTPLSVGL